MILDNKPAPCPVPHLMDFSLQMQAPSLSQMPLVWPRVTQLVVQAQLPREHRNPALTRREVTSTTSRVVIGVENIVSCVVSETSQ